MNNDYNPYDALDDFFGDADEVDIDFDIEGHDMEAFYDEEDYGDEYEYDGNESFMDYDLMAAYS